MGSLRILVVEDELIIAAHIATMLREMGHEVVATVASAAEAVHSADAEHPDLVLMDVALRGGTSGIEAANQIRRARSVPIAFMTAYSATELASQYDEPDALLCLAKPVTEAKLEAIIRSVLGQG